MHLFWENSVLIVTFHRIVFYKFFFTFIEKFLFKDLQLFGRVELNKKVKLAEDGIQIIADRGKAVEIHNKILC